MASQQVLAGVLRGLDVTPAEVPGGLSYLLGVLATCHGSVSTVALPLALDLVEDPAGLTELTAVVAGRPERRHQLMVLRALRGARLRDRAGGVDAVLEALRTLGEGDDDAAFAAEVARAREALGEESTDGTESRTTAGLWTRTPHPQPVVS